MSALRQMLGLALLSLFAGGSLASADPFGFPSFGGVWLNTQLASDPVTPTGYSGSAVVSVVGGEYSVGCSGTFTATDGSISPGQSVCVRHMTSSSYGATVTTRLTVGDVTGTFSSTTVTRASAPFRVATGSVHTCAINRAGGLKCWGKNDFGQLGSGNLGYHSSVPVDVVGLTRNVVAVSAGPHFACALVTSGTVKCWGDNSAGQLGIGRLQSQGTPQDVPGLSGVTAISAGAKHTCALMSGGTPYCWGYNLFGQLGDGTTSSRTSAAGVSSLPDGVAAIAAGNTHTCALTTLGAMKCWGRNANGQLGDGTTTDRLTPVTVSGKGSGVMAIGAGSSLAKVDDGHTCLVTVDGGAQCWGYNGFGQLGNGSASDSATPTNVRDLSSGMAAVEPGSDFTCALGTSGGVNCWGKNDVGQLGNGTEIDSATPVSPLSTGVAAVSAGERHACALTTSGGLKCWGLNNWGQLGIGVYDWAHMSPLDVNAFEYDTAPYPFGFETQTGVSTNAPVISNTIVPTGYSATTNIAVVQRGNGWYSIGCNGSFTDVPTSISPGQSVCAKVILYPGQSYASMELNIGGVIGSFLVSPYSPPTIGASSPLPAGSVASIYSQSLMVSGGTGAYNVEISAGSLPAGLVLDASGTIKGTPTSAGNYQFTVKVTDTESRLTASKSFELTIGLPVNETLTLARAGSGSGVVTSSPPGINCGSSCSADYVAGTTILLSAAANEGSTFTGWSGACSGTSTCTLTMNSAKSVTAIFTLQRLVLTVSKEGTGSGTVNSSPAGIACGNACIASFDFGTQVSLAAVPAAGSVFTGWSGACTGTGVCTVTMNAPKGVIATFVLATTLPRLVNLSTRAPVLTGDNVMIGGFIIQGSTPKKVLVTARGPSMAAQGVTGALADPFLTLYSGATPIATNDDFGSASNASEIPASMRPSDAKESAILTTLDPGAYTAIVTGVDRATGIGIVEAFEVDKPETPLINIAARAPVFTGDNVMIGGFIIQGDSQKTVVIRARGPSLATAGVPGVLADPTVTLYSGAEVIASNDNWQTNANAAAIESSGFAPSDPRESALLKTLNPGAYTVIVSGANGSTGIGIVEVFAQ